AARLDDGREPAVLEIDGVLDAALAAELESQLRPGNLCVLVAHGGQTERPVLPRVFFIADADQCFLEQLYDRCEHLLARQTAARHDWKSSGRSRRRTGIGSGVRCA